LVIFKINKAINMALTLKQLANMATSEKQDAIIAEIARCKKDPVYFIENYVKITDAVTGVKIPFKLYSYQKTALETFEKADYCMSMKSRQMGFTTVTAAYAAWFLATKSNMIVNVLANKLRTSRKFLKTVRQMLDYARTDAPWLVADYVYNNNGKDSFTLKTGSTITAESNNEDACRGETINLLIIDEVAAIDRSNPERMAEIWSSAGITLTRSRGKCIAISTPKGQSGWYFEQYTNANVNGWTIIDAHWIQHPIYSQGAYQYIKDPDHPEGGYIKYFNETWPTTTDKKNQLIFKTKETYGYILDGKLRSPWYDAESKRLGPNRTKCELDCSFAGSGGEVIDSEQLRTMLLKAREVKIINPVQKGIWKSFKQYKSYNPGHGYVLSADVATGDGTDFSAFVVVDLTTREVVATFKDQLEPTVFAKIITDVGNTYGACMAIVEYQGPGLTVLTELKNLKYTNIYHHTLKKQDITKTQKRKPGFWQSDSTRTLGGDKLEEVINTSELTIYSEDIINELYTWIWDKDGKRRHAPGKNDDLIMALSNAVFYMYFVAPKREVNNFMMKTQFNIQRVGIFNQSAWGFEDIKDLGLTDF
jgi:hypothetical protein